MKKQFYLELKSKNNEIKTRKKELYIHQMQINILERDKKKLRELNKLLQKDKRQLHIELNKYLGNREMFLNKVEKNAERIGTTNEEPEC